MLRRGARSAGPARDPAPAAPVLALCTAAVLCGNAAMEDVTAWVAAAPQQVLTAAGCRRNALGACVPPHPDTVVRIFTALGAQALADHAGAYLAGRDCPGPVAFPLAGPGWLPAVAVDGKAVRGAAGPDGLIPYLLAAASHRTGAVLAAFSRPLYQKSAGSSGHRRHERAAGGDEPARRPRAEGGYR